MQPEIQTPRLILRAACEADVDSLWALWTDAQVRRFLWDDRTITREQARNTIEDLVALSSRGLGLWIVARHQIPHALIGCAALAPVRTAAAFDHTLNGAIEPTIAIAPEFWRRGYATEALTALIKYAISSLSIDRLVAVVDVPNVESDRLIRRLGFAVTGEADGPRHRLRVYRFNSSD